MSNAELIVDLRSRAQEGHYSDRGVRFWFRKAADAIEAATAERDAARAVIAEARGIRGLQDLFDGELEPEDGWRVAGYVIEALDAGATS
jgi:hypothetical protein